MRSWDDLRYVLAVVRHGSHARAGRALGVASTTIGRRLRAVEKELSGRLFDRTPEGLVATALGRAVGERAERVESEILASERQAVGADVRLEGTLRITTGDGLMTYILAPALVEFRRSHPGIDLELRGDNRALDLARREADVAVRLFRPREPSLVARKLGVLSFAIFGSDPYLSRRGRPRSLRELAAHDFVAYDASLDDAPQARFRRRHAPRARIVVRSSTTTALVASCAAGHGLAILPSAFARSDPRLVRVLPRATVPAREVWAAFHPDLRGGARISALVEWLTGLFGSED